MSHNAPNEYLRNAVMTATQEQLQLMLYDGAIRFARQGREAMSTRNLDDACEKLLKAQRIVMQMKAGLRPEVNPALCENLTGLYNFIYWRLVEANTKHDPAVIDEALQILEHQRETWRLLLEKIREVPGRESGPVSEKEGPTRSAVLSLEG